MSITVRHLRVLDAAGRGRNSTWVLRRRSLTWQRSFRSLRRSGKSRSKSRSAHPVFARGELGPINSSSQTGFKKFTQTAVYRIGIQGIVYTLNLMIVDAACSGDWSRIGVISHETEVTLQQISIGLFVVHALSTAGVVTLNIRRDKPWLLPSIKTFAIGILALVQQIYEEEETARQQITPLFGLAAIVGASVGVKAIMHSFGAGSV